MSTEQRNIELLEISGIMAAQGGRNVMRRIIELAKTFDDTFHSDPLVHAHNAGQRMVGIRLVRELEEACPDLYLRLLKERNDDNR